MLTLLRAVNSKLKYEVTSDVVWDRRS